MQLIICNNSIKNKLLNDSNTLINRKFMTRKELINSYYFSYDLEAIYYLMDKYGYKYNVACVYLDNLIYIEDKVYNSDKLNFLVRLKKELDDNNLLIYDNYFKEYIKNKDIIIYGDYFNKLESNLINELGYNVEHINTNKLISYSNISDKLKCGKMLDDLVKYGSINSNLDLYYNNYQIDYNGKNVFYNYCNKYKNYDKIYVAKGR